MLANSLLNSGYLFRVFLNSKLAFGANSLVGLLKIAIIETGSPSILRFVSGIDKSTGVVDSLGSAVRLIID